MNLHVIVGRLGHDPELAHLPSGTVVCNASVATDESYKDAGGQKVEQTTWHRVTLFGAQAEAFVQYLTKGRMVAITGSVRRRKGQDNEGSEREYVDTLVRKWEFVDSGGAQQAGNGQRQARNGNRRRNTQQRRQPRQQRQQESQAGAFDDDIPF